MGGACECDLVGVLMLSRAMAVSCLCHDGEDEGCTDELYSAHEPPAVGDAVEASADAVEH